MALTVIPQDASTVQAQVLRPICMRGERVEPGAVIELTRIQYAELSAAAKVGPAPAAARKPAARKAAATSATPSTPAADAAAATSEAAA